MRKIKYKYNLDLAEQNQFRYKRKIFINFFFISIEFMAIKTNTIYVKR